MFNELPESVDREELKKLFEKKVFERKIEKTGQILEALKDDSNQIPYNLLSDYLKKSNAGIHLEDLDQYLEAHVFDSDGQFVATIGIGVDPNDFTTETVSQETYEYLKNQCLDIDLIEADVKNSLSDAR